MRMQDSPLNSADESASDPSPTADAQDVKRVAPLPLPIDALRWYCPPEDLPFETTADVQPAVGVVGQQGAVDALRFGLEIHAPGQNIFVRGLEGTGRMTLVRRLMQDIRLTCPDTKDRCYVCNFAQPDRPRLITLPRGKGPAFRKRIDRLSKFVRTDLAKALSSDAMRARWSAIERRNQKDIQALIEPFEQSLRDAGLALVSFQAGPVVQAAIVPAIDGKPVPPEELEQMRSAGQVTDEQMAEFRKRQESFSEQLADITTKVNEIRRNHADTLQDMRQKAARSLILEPVRNIERDFPQPEVHKFLHELIEDALTRPLEELAEDAELARLHQVNVLVTRTDTDECPIAVENTPTMVNLLGTIDRRNGPREAPTSDHLMIRAGSLLRADGGFLILEGREVLREPGAWRVLVRTLRTGRLEIVPPEMSGPWFGPSLKPDSIEIDVKVILIGGDDTYYMLDEYDPDFPHLFKVLADFDTVIPKTAQGAQDYAAVLARIVQDEDLLPFDRSGVAALVEHGARIASRHGKLTARFSRIADIAREASFFAKGQNGKLVDGKHVRIAVARTKRRADLPSRRFRELLSDGTIRVQTFGRVVGQVNGLAVLQAGPLTYGFPARITATIGPGTAGVINIDTEAALSGAIHTKGFYILRGLLRHLLRTFHPLTYHASVAFEQSYGYIDGDSASCAEMCCLLSALTDVPLRQDLAITGAIDQHGHVQPIGGVNEKIEGFFDTCQDVGMTGTQGVIVPQANAGDLMLREDVVEACRAGTFRVYAVDSVHQALELLSDMPAGTLDVSGAYPDNTLLGLAVQRAFEYWVRASRSADSLEFEEVEEDEEPAQE